MKSVVQARILSASSVVVWNGEKKLQIVENRVWRQIVGVNTVNGRDRKINFKFEQHIFRTSSELFKTIDKRMNRKSRSKR